MKRILVRAPNWIGDQVMAYPFFSQLKKNNPQAWIGVVCTEWVKDIQFRGYVDEVFVLPKLRKKTILSSFRSINRIAEELRQKGPWDLGFLLPNSFGSALLFHLAKVQEIHGYKTDMRSMFLHEKVEWNPDPSIHRADTYLNLLRTESFPVDPAVSYLKKFDPLKHWPAVTPLEAPKDRYIVIAPGATADSRRWGVEKFASLIKLVHEKWGYRSVVVGGAAEELIAKQFTEQNLPVINYVGKGSVSSLWRVFQNAQFIVCNESGLAHVASLCGAKVQIVCGAADPKRTKPIGPGEVQVLTNSKVSCWPCEKNVCQFLDERKNQCHEGIQANEVLNKIEGGFYV
jgi:heptosyltransferase-2